MVYNSDKEAMKRRIHELEEVVERYRTKRVGPYEVDIKITGPHWNGIAVYLEWMAKKAKNCGPDSLGICGGDSEGYGYQCSIKSNTTGGNGENSGDKVIPSNKSDVAE